MKSLCEFEKGGVIIYRLLVFSDAHIHCASSFWWQFSSHLKTFNLGHLQILGKTASLQAGFVNESTFLSITVKVVLTVIWSSIFSFLSHAKNKFSIIWRVDWRLLLLNPTIMTSKYSCGINRLWLLCCMSCLVCVCVCCGDGGGGTVVAHHHRCYTLAAWCWIE